MWNIKWTLNSVVSLKVVSNYPCVTKLCAFLAHLKVNTCTKIVPVVVLLASSRQGIYCSKGE